MQFLLGGFYYVESAVLLEDFVESVNHTDNGPVEGVTYYTSSDITNAYRNAA